MSETTETSVWADLDLSAAVEQVARVVWDQQKPPEIAWDRVNEITRRTAREAVLPFVVATRDALADDVEAMLDRARAEAWDEGRATGFSRAMRYMSDEPGVDTNPRNPYRVGGAS